MHIKDFFFSVALLACALCSACAGALPLLGGGSTTPRGRADFAIAGAARAPLGNLRNREGVDLSRSRYRESAEKGGVIPVAASRYGIGQHWDLGVQVAGTTLRLEGRREFVLRESVNRPSAITGFAGWGGWIPGDDGGNGYRVGAEVPVFLGVEFGGLYEVWGGVRVAAEHVGGTFLKNEQLARAAVWAARAGPVVGFAAGFRRVHAFIELSTFYEGWFGEHGNTSIRRSGVVFVPAWGLRLRL